MNWRARVSPAVQSPILNHKNKIGLSRERASESPEVVGDRGRKFAPVTRAGVVESQPPRVEHLALCSGTGDGGPGPFPSPAVHLIADHRMADVGEVDPDLVGTPRLQVEAQHGHPR